MGTFAFLLGLPMLKSYVAFSAVSAAPCSSACLSSTAHNNTVQVVSGRSSGTLCIAPGTSFKLRQLKAVTPNSYSQGC